jgi:MarR family transcriptional regulator, organic hydroperoxide resistance regulator
MNSLRRIVRMIRLADGAGEISAAQRFVLQSLSAAPASSLAELAKRTLTDQSSVSTVVSKLVDKKLVARTPSATDRRRAELRLTAAGTKLVKQMAPLPQTRIIDAVAALPAKPRAELVRALERLVLAIGADELEPRMFLEDS